MDGVNRIVGREGHRLLVELASGDLGWVEDADRKAGSKRLRRMDLVEKLMREGSIGVSEKAAAAMFEEHYEAAHLRARYPAMSFEGRVSHASSSDAIVESAVQRSEQAAGQHRAACRAIGGYAATTLIDVLCNEVRITDYPKSEQAKRRAGVVCGLQALAAFYGMV